MARSDLAAEITTAAPIRELTLRGFLHGTILALILFAANAIYLGLYAGMMHGVVEV